MGRRLSARADVHSLVGSAAAVSCMWGSAAFIALRCGKDQRRPLFDGLVADLMGAPVLVADAPEVDVLRPGVAVVLAHPGVGALAGIAILDPVPHFLDGAIASVVADIGLPSQEPAELDELIGAEGIWLNHAPGHVICRPALLPDPGFPVIAAGVASPRPADYGNPQCLQRRKDVFSESPFVGQRGTGHQTLHRIPDGRSVQEIRQRSSCYKRRTGHRC